MMRAGIDFVLQAVTSGYVDSLRAPKTQAEIHFECRACAQRIVERIKSETAKKQKSDGDGGGSTNVPDSIIEGHVLHATNVLFDLVRVSPNGDRLGLDFVLTKIGASRVREQAPVCRTSQTAV